MYKKFKYINPVLWTWIMGEKLNGLTDKEIIEMWKKQFPGYKWNEWPEAEYEERTEVG